MSVSYFLLIMCIGYTGVRYYFPYGVMSALRKEIKTGAPGTPAGQRVRSKERVQGPGEARSSPAGGSCEIAIYIDLDRAVQDGMAFYITEEGSKLRSNIEQMVVASSIMAISWQFHHASHHLKP